MKTIDYCIKIISDHINGKQTKEPVETINWDKVVRYFKCHELIGILYYQCKGFIPDKYTNLMEQQNASVMYYYNNRIWIEKQIKEELEKKGIRYCIIKGSAVAEYYPFHALRTMGDTDLVVHSKDRDVVNNVLLSIGFKNYKRLDHGDWQYFKNNMELEMHDRLVYKRLKPNDVCYDFFNNLWKYEKDGVLDWSFHFLYLIHHLLKHFMIQGVGLRHFIDIAVLTKNNTDLNWTWIKTKLIELDMWEFAQRIFFLNRRWFGIAPPISISKYSDEFLHDATKLIFFNGVFGYENGDNDWNSTVNNINTPSNKGYGLRKFISALFPSYEIMSKLDYSSFVEGRKFLLPVAWMYRWMRALKGKRATKMMKRITRSSFVSKRKVQKRREVLKKWGVE